MKLIFFKVFFLIFTIWIYISINDSSLDKYIHIVFCDVGQGDAVLITYKNKQMLVDGGPDEKVLSCLENHMPFWDKSIDFLVISHMDSDHIGGLPLVLSRYSVDVILKNPSPKETAVFEALETAISRKTTKNKGTTNVLSSYIGQQLVMGDLVRSIVVSPQVKYKLTGMDKENKTETILSDRDAVFEPILSNNVNENDLSIGLFVMIGDVSLWLAGDMEEQGELAVIESGMIDHANIIKAGHHGSKSSSSRQFISILRPEISVISSGKNNQYNHPSPRVIDVFREFEVDIYRTDSQETIEFITDGVNYWRSI